MALGTVQYIACRKNLIGALHTTALSCTECKAVTYPLVSARALPPPILQLTPLLIDGMPVSRFLRPGAPAWRLFFSFSSPLVNKLVRAMCAMECIVFFVVFFCGLWCFVTFNVD